MNKTLHNLNRNNPIIDKAKELDTLIEKLFIFHIKLFSELFGYFFIDDLLLDLVVNIIFPELVQRV